MDIKNTNEEQTLPRSFFDSLTKHITPSLLTYPLKGIASFLFARGIIFGISAPFGLCAAAALGSRKGALWGLCGAMLGYFSIIGRINSLKYIACLILIFTAHFVFDGTSLSKHRLFTPFSLIFPVTCVNFIFIVDAGFPLIESAISVFEIFISAIGAYFLTPLTSDDDFSPRECAMSYLTLALILAAALCTERLFGVVSPGRVLAFVTVLLCSFSGGTGFGATVGILSGIAISLAMSDARYSFLYGIVGVCTFPGMKRGAFASCVSACAVALFAAVCIDSKFLLSTFLELLSASVIFLPLSSVFSRLTRKFFTKRSSSRDMHFKTYASERLKLASTAFRALGELLGNTSGIPKSSALSLDSVFDRAAREHCKKCKLSSICWERDFEATRDAVIKASDALKIRGTLCAKDFPIHFSSRCLHIENLVNTINREICTLRCKLRFDGRIRESHELLTKQYSDASRIFSDISSDISDSARYDEDAENEIRDFLASHGVLCDSAVYRDCEGHLNIHLCGKDLSYVVSEFGMIGRHLSLCVGTHLTAPEYVRGNQLDDVIIREKPRFKGIFGSASRRRSGSEINGDSGSFFRPTSSKLAILLSDGMGSGRLAARDSATSITLLENLLKSGIPPQDALSTLQSALTVKSEYTSSFATLDLMYFDTYSAICEIYKYGGAPTYIKRGKQLRRISASTLPAGITVGKLSHPDRTSLTLLPGDFVIMTSDGISDGNDEKLLAFISSSEANTPASLADAIMEYAISINGKGDDMTVAVLLIEKEE